MFQKQFSDKEWKKVGKKIQTKSDIYDEKESASGEEYKGISSEEFLDAVRKARKPQKK